MSNEVWDWVKIAAGGATGGLPNLEVGGHYLLEISAPVDIPDWMAGPVATAIHLADLSVDVTSVTINGNVMDVEFTKSWAAMAAGVSPTVILTVIRGLLGLAGFAFTLYVLVKAEQQTGAVSGAVSGIGGAIQATGQGAQDIAKGGGLLLLGGIVVLFLITR